MMYGVLCMVYGACHVSCMMYVMYDVCCIMYYVLCRFDGVSWMMNDVCHV